MAVKNYYMSSGGFEKLGSNSVSSRLENKAGASLKTRRMLETPGSGTGQRNTMGVSTLLVSPEACHHSSVPCLLTVGITCGSKQI